MSSTPPPGGRRVSDAQPWQAPARTRIQPDELRAAGLYVNEDDDLIVVIYNAVAGVSVEMRLRTVMDDGRIVPQTFNITPTTNRARHVTALDVSECFIVGCSAVLSAGSTRRGQCFVQVSLGRGPAATPIVLHPLISDYVTPDESPAWPGGLIRQSIEGPGVLRSVAGTDPAVGAEVTDAVPTGARWRLRGVRFPLVTSAAVANRRVHLVIDDGATKLLELAAADVQAATLTRNYNCAPDGFARATQDLEIYVPLPLDVMMLQGWRIRTSTTALDAGDNFGPPQYAVEEWIEA